MNELLLLGVLIFSLVSCKSADGVPANLDLNHKIDSGSETDSKIYLSEASSQQLEERIAECPANPNGHRQCFVICHVPKGNPNNRHSLIVPLPAVNAHITHHHGADPHGSDKGKGKGPKDKGEYRGDYMGRCDGSGTGGTTGGSTDGSTTGGTDGGTTGSTDGSTTGGTDGGTTGSTDGSTTGGTTGGTTGSTDGSTTGGIDGGTTGGTDDPPVFCEWTHPMDLDCDGRNDETGELIF